MSRNPCVLNDRERQLWVDNDEGLYNWWKSSRQGKRAFIQENKADIDTLIKRALGCDDKGGLRGLKRRKGRSLGCGCGR